MAEKHPDVDWEGIVLQELNEAQWESIVRAQMRAHEERRYDVTHFPKRRFLEN
jgi:hypothetical protein